MTFIARAGLTGLFVLLLSLVAQAATLPVIRLTAGSGALDVEVASNKSQRSLGLMNRVACPNRTACCLSTRRPPIFACG
jgi:hypothetical protein